MLPACQHGNLYPVTVHGMHTVALGHQNGFSAVLRLKGVLAVGFTVEYTFHYLCRCIKLVAETGLFLDIVIHQQRLQYIHQQHLGRMGVQVQFPI